MRSSARPIASSSRSLPAGPSSSSPSGSPLASSRETPSASRTPSQGAAGCGVFHRSSPTGATLFIEAPASFPAQSEEVAEVELSNGRTALVLAPEDVLIYRLHEFVATGHREVASQGVALLEIAQLDRRRLAKRLVQEGLTNAFEALERLAERVRKGETVESHELHEIAKSLEEQG